MPRFQRSRCTSTPRSALLWKAKLRLVEGLRELVAWRVGEVEGEVVLPGRDRLAVEQRRAAWIAETSRTTTCAAAPRPPGSSAACQSTAGAAAARPARSIGLLVAFTSRRRSGGQWHWASSVSSAMTGWRAARPASVAEQLEERVT